MLKTLKSLFVVEQETPQEQEQPSKKQTDAQNTASKTVHAASTTQEVRLGALDQSIIDKLLEAIDKNNLDGFDYLEFKKAIKALDKIPMDEPTKYRSTFAAASTMGLTLETLLSSTTHYLQVLEKENTTFNNAFKGQLEAKIGGKEKEITQLEALIAQKSEQIKLLTKQITEHQQQIDTYKGVLDENKRKIEKTKEDFKHSYLHLKNQLEKDMAKMKQYLQ